MHWSEDTHSYQILQPLPDSYNTPPYQLCHFRTPGKNESIIEPLVYNLLHPDDSRVQHLLAQIQDPATLWSEFGVRGRSLLSSFNPNSTTSISPEYNVRLLASLLELARSSQDEVIVAKAKEIYTWLRVNVFEGVYRVWVDQGFVWERYEVDEAGKLRGKGMRAHTGTRAAVVRLMMLPDLEDDVEVELIE